MQVDDPIKLTLKAPGTKRLTLKCDEPLSNVALIFNLRRYNLMAHAEAMFRAEERREVDVRDLEDSQLCGLNDP